MDTTDPRDVLWDVALEALLNQQFQEEGQALDLPTLRGLAEHHTIRLDDILDTLCKLTGNGEWVYSGSDGMPCEPDRDMCRLLRANHRLNEVQLERLGGRWRPAS